MSTFLYERMIRVEACGLVCRIWRAESAIDNSALSRMAMELMCLPLGALSLRELVARLVEVEGVNSVEVTSRETGCGLCVHKDWP